MGGARTALFEYLQAKKEEGTFLLRIEDTDRKRLVEGAEEGIYEILKWLGITWTGTPIRQSERQEIYQKFAQQLIAEGNAYYCFCSEERLKQLHENNQFAKYDKHCRHLTSAEIKKQIDLLNERLKDKFLTMELADNAYHEIAKLGYDERYGARPLARMFTKYIIKPLSEKILSGQMTKGHYKIYFDDKVKDLQFHFELLH